MISPYIAAAGLIVSATAIMLFLISESAEKIMDRPILAALAGEDGRSFRIENFGNKPALDINAGVLPFNLEFLIEMLPAGEEKKINCERLIGNSRVILNYSDEKGIKYTKSADFSTPLKHEYDPAKPLIPIFR